MKSFSQTKIDFDKKNNSNDKLIAFLPVHLSINKEVTIKNSENMPNEEYYKWQYFHSIVFSGLYPKDYIGTEVSFPKGNKNSAPIKLDGAIFDDKDWFDWYKKWHLSKDQTALDWLRKHLLGAIEFKQEDARNIEATFNQQLKPALKESENDFCLGVLYDTERLFLFQKKINSVLRLDESFNLKHDKSTTKELSLHLPDAYYKMPSLDQLKKRIISIKIDRSKRTIDDLDIITGIYSKQLTDGISNIIRTMDKVGMKSQRGYEILIQILALKIYDEKRSAKIKSLLDFYKTNGEKDRLDLLFYITPDEKNYAKLSDKEIQKFIQRMRNLYNEAASEYHYVLNRDDTETISWRKEDHIRIISEVVEQFQDYSFVKSNKTDLYQIIFYKFANEFSKADKGQFVTPIPLIDFLVKIVNPRNNEKVIDPTSGIGDFLSIAYVNSESKLDDKNMFGLDNDEHMIMLAQLNMLLNGDGNAILKYKPDLGSITWKFDSRDNLVELDPSIHKKGDWDSWVDQTKLKKFDVVLTNPPFGDDRKYEPKSSKEKEIIEMYELWHLARNSNSIDRGLIFFENAYRILGENGRLGIVLSNSIASIERWQNARKWLLEKMRVVALFDLPANVFADTGVNTTLIVAYKPSPSDLNKLKERNYDIFIRDIQKVGYEIRTVKRVKFFNPIYKINKKTFEVEQNQEGQPLLDEEFTQTIEDFQEWCLTQENNLQDLFIKKK